jgi:hypothetical protein
MGQMSLFTHVYMSLIKSQGTRGQVRNSRQTLQVSRIFQKKLRARVKIDKSQRAFCVFSLKSAYRDNTLESLSMFFSGSTTSSAFCVQPATQFSLSSTSDVFVLLRASVGSCAAVIYRSLVPNSGDRTASRPRGDERLWLIIGRSLLRKFSHFVPNVNQKLRHFTRLQSLIVRLAVSASCYHGQQENCRDPERDH